MERIGLWQRCKSRSTGAHYWFNPESKQSVWEDATLPHGWAWGKDAEHAPVWYINLYTGAKQSEKPAAAHPPTVAPALAHPAPPAAPAAASNGPTAPNGTALALTASLTAGDDLLSEAYIPDERPEVRGSNIPANIASKRNYLFSSVPPELQWRLQVDAVALYSITEARLAEDQSRLIEKKCVVAIPPSDRKSPKDLVVVDGTACVGGNTLSFARHFGLVHGVELSEQRARMLQHNARVCGYGEGKVKVHCASFLDVFTPGSKLNQALLGGAPAFSYASPMDVCFFDPPWGGPEYKNATSLDMFLGTVDVAEIIASLTTPFSSHPALSRYVVLKAPLNYNVAGLKNVLKRTNPGISVVEERQMWKMMLLVIKAAENNSAATMLPGLLKQLLPAAPPAVIVPTVAGVKRGSAEAGLDASGGAAAKRPHTTEGEVSPSRPVLAVPQPISVLEELLMAPASTSALSAEALAAATTNGIPLLRQTGIAGKGRRAGDVFEVTPREHPSFPTPSPFLKGHTKLVVKRQPLDARTAKEIEVCLALLNNEVIAADSASKHPLVALPLYLAEGLPRGTASTAVSFAVYPHAGKSLEDILAAPAAPVNVTLTDVVAVLQRVLTALEHLHSSGYLYLDLHLGNVLVSKKEDGSGDWDFSTACLIDLGSVQKMEAVAASSDGSPTGPCYRGPTRGGVWDSMPPEQFGKGKWANEGEVELYPSSDLFSLASLAIKLLLKGACAPFNPAVGADPNAFFAQLRAGGPSSVSKPKLTVEDTSAARNPLRQRDDLLDSFIRGGIDYCCDGGGTGREEEKEGLFAVLSKALQSKPKDRWQSAKEMKETLMNISKKNI
jgi:serine/threonine protein kinase